ncbi:MAG: hypothetical protein EOO20_20360 [Chryseobacterium sp.]|nr:MAG: hypothetical protein EOO20_20360 [Chryseobacterium sp.]
MKDELDDLKATLLEFEMPYREGAWENFQQRKSKSALVIYSQPLLKYAAVWLFLLTLPFALQEKLIHPGSFLAKSVESAEKTVKTANSMAIPLVVKERISHVQNGEAFKYEDDQVSIRYISSVALPPIEQRSVYAPASLQLAVVPFSPGGAPSVNDKFLEFLENEQTESKYQMNNEVERKKIEYAFSIGASTDSRTLEKLNVEAGISVPINKSFSIYSGLNMGSFGTAQQLNEPATTEKSAALLRADLNGISVPLEVEYRPTERIFLKGGMSASLILKGSGSLSYSEKSSSFQSFTDPQGNMQIREVVTDKQVVEEIAGAKISPSRPVLFYNISAGYRIALFSSAKIGMEPYLRVPVSSYGDYKLNLFQGGIKFRVDF